MIGDSHIYAIQAALEKLKLVPPALDFEALRLGAAKNGKIAGDVTLDGAIGKVKSLSRHDVFVALLRGNHFNSIGLIQHPQPFDILMPSESPEGLRSDAHVIPVQMLRSCFEESLTSGYGEHLLQLRRSCAARMVCLTPPAPKEDAEHIKKGAETYFRDLGINEIGVTPAPLRLKLWTLQQQALEAFCRANDIIYFDNPPDARDAAGFLKRKYYAGDATHGNKEYGSRVLWQIAGLMEMQSQPSTQDSPPRVAG